MNLTLKCTSSPEHVCEVSAASFSYSTWRCWRENAVFGATMCTCIPCEPAHMESCYWQSYIDCCREHDNHSTQYTIANVQLGLRDFHLEENSGSSNMSCCAHDVHASHATQDIKCLEVYISEACSISDNYPFQIYGYIRHHCI